MTEPSDFEFFLSRIEAQGWNAAHRLMAGEACAPSSSRIAALNPHPSDPERARWRTGFDNAIARREAK